MKRIIIALALACVALAIVPVASAAVSARRPITPPQPQPDHGPTLPPDPWVPI